MAVIVRLREDQLPSPSAWQKAIHERQFEVDIDCDFSPTEMSGFLPARYRGESAGFEYFFERGGPSGQAQVSLVWSGELREAASAVIAAACLCHLADGELEDPGADERVPAASAVDWARRQEAEIRDAITEEETRPDRVSAPDSAPPRPWWRFW